MDSWVVTCVFGQGGERKEGSGTEEVSFFSFSRADVSNFCFHF